MIQQHLDWKIEDYMKIAINCGHTLKGPGSGAVEIIDKGIETRKVGRK